VTHCVGADARSGEQLRYRRRHDLQEKLVANPALFHCIVEVGTAHAVVIHEIAAVAAGLEHGGERGGRGRPDQHRNSRIAVGQFLSATGACQPRVAGHHERGAGRVAQRIDESTGAGAQRRAQVQGRRGLRQIEGTRQHHGIVPIRERGGG
jgi:hypothetical protein